MIKPKDPRELAEAMISRSTCTIKVGAVIEDDYGIISWGWNSSGPDGFGLHAEAHCIRRANRQRLWGSTIYVASLRARNSKVVTSKPCPDCQHLIDKYNLTCYYRDSDGEWRLSNG